MWRQTRHSCQLGQRGDRTHSIGTPSKVRNALYSVTSRGQQGRALKKCRSIPHNHVDIDRMKRLHLGMSILAMLPQVSVNRVQLPHVCHMEGCEPVRAEVSVPRSYDLFSAGQWDQWTNLMRRLPGCACSVNCLPRLFERSA